MPVKILALAIFSPAVYRSGLIRIALRSQRSVVTMDDELEREIVGAMCVAYDRAMIGGTFPMKDALAVAKPMIERELLRELLAYMNKHYDDCISVDITEWADERGIDLEAETNGR